MRLSIHGVRGRRVAGFAPRALPPGPHALVWDGRGDDGRRSAKGVYFFRLQVGDAITTGKVVLLR
ncbi:hypothetical protein H8E07_05980 [bacterium]|nr:hypothetical protein [bacterium]